MIGLTGVDWVLIFASLGAGIACLFAALRAGSGRDPSNRTAAGRSWEALGGVALIYSLLHWLRGQSPEGVGRGDATFVFWMALRMAALALVVFWTLRAVGTIPALAAVWRSLPLLARLEVAASVLAIGFVGFLFHHRTAPVLIVDIPLWGLLWSATFAGGLALGVTALVLVVARPGLGAEPVIALGMLAWSVGATTTGYGGAGRPDAWIAGWLLLLVASFRPMSSVVAGQDDVRLAWIGRTVPAILFAGALASVAFAWLLASTSVTLLAGLVVVVAALVRRLVPPGADGRPGWRDWRRRLSTPGILLTVLVLVTLWLVSRTFLLGPPPYDDVPEIAFAVRGFHPQALNGFRVDVAMSAGTGRFGMECQNPVLVTAVISGTPEMWKHAAGPLASSAHFGIAVTSSRPIRELRAGLAKDATAPIAPPLYEDPDQQPPINPTVKATFRLLDLHAGSASSIPSLAGPRSAEPIPYAVAGSIKDWKSSWIPLIVQFEADWMQRRSLGSCYVLLPSLTGKSGDPEDALLAAVQAAHDHEVAADADYADAEKRVLASHGRIDLWPGGADVVAEQSNPPPASPGSGQSNPTWSCSSSPLDLAIGQHDLQRSPSGKGLALPNDQPLPGASSCGGFAVVSTGPSQLIREFSLIIIGVFVSMIIEIIYSEVRGRRT